MRLGLLLPPGGLMAGYAGSIKDFVVDLPPGFVGDPQATPKCPQVDISRVGFEPRSRSCPRATQIGVATNYLQPAGAHGARVGYQHDHSLWCADGAGVQHGTGKGYPAQFAFEVDGVVSTLHVNVNQETNYGVRVIVTGIPQVGGCHRGRR